MFQSIILPREARAPDTKVCTNTKCGHFSMHFYLNEGDVRRFPVVISSFFSGLRRMEPSELVTVTFSDTKNHCSSKYLSVAPTPRVETSRQFTSALPTEGVVCFISALRNLPSVNWRH